MAGNSFFKIMQTCHAVRLLKVKHAEMETSCSPESFPADKLLNNNACDSSFLSFDVPAWQVTCSWPEAVYQTGTHSLAAHTMCICFNINHFL